MKNNIKKISPLFALIGLLCLTSCSGEQSKTDDEGKVYLSCWINEGNNFEGSTKDSALLQIEKKCGVNLQVTGAAHNADYYSTLNPKVNTGEVPDIIFTVPSAQGNGYNNWIDQDLIWDYDELMAEKPGEYPYLEKIFSDSRYKNIQFGDNMHTLLPFFTTRSGWAVYYRSDWLKKIGYTNTDGSARTPVNMDEFQDVMKKFTENDPDGNGKNDTYGMSPGGTMTCFNPLYHAFGVTTDYDLDKNNEPTYQFLQPEFKNFLTWANDMYKKGYIDPQFAANTANTDDRENFANGTSGILITNGYSHVQWIVNRVESKNGKGTCTVGPAPVGTDTIGVKGAGGFSDWGGWWGGFSISKTCPDPHAALKFLNYINGPEGNDLFHDGILGTHYNLVDGKVVPNVEERDKEPQTTFYMVSDENGDKNPIGEHQLGTHFQAKLKWNEDETKFDYVVSDASIPYEYRSYFHLTDELNTLFSSKLTNITCWPGTFTTRMNKVEDYSATFAINAIMGKDGYDLTNGWATMFDKIEQNSYEWSKIKAMIKDVAHNCGII